MLSNAAQRAIETWAVDRSYFVVDPAEVREIRIERGGERRVLEPARPGARDAGTAERFELARRELSEMRAEGLVHTGPPRSDEGFDRPLLVVTVELRASRIKMSVGRGDAWRDTSVFYARRDGIDATFALAQNKVRPLLDLR